MRRIELGVAASKDGTSSPKAILQTATETFDTTQAEKKYNSNSSI